VGKSRSRFWEEMSPPYLLKKVGRKRPGGERKEKGSGSLRLLDVGEERRDDPDTKGRARNGGGEDKRLIRLDDAERRGTGGSSYLSENHVGGKAPLRPREGSGGKRGFPLLVSKKEGKVLSKLDAAIRRGQKKRRGAPVSRERGKQDREKGKKNPLHCV